jgi:hypothetical protein
MDLDPSQYGEADRRQVDPPVQVESAGGTLDWWVRERATSGSVGYGVKTVVRSGSRLRIFVPKRLVS